MVFSSSGGDGGSADDNCLDERRNLNLWLPCCRRCRRAVVVGRRQPIGWLPEVGRATASKQASEQQQTMSLIVGRRADHRAKPPTIAPQTKRIFVAHCCTGPTCLHEHTTNNGAQRGAERCSWPLSSSARARARRRDRIFQLSSVNSQIID